MALTIHLGAHKTASTHLQQSLKVAQDALQAGGVFLADPSMLRDEGPIPLAQALAEGPGRAGDKASREALARLRDACPHLLISEENILGGTARGKLFSSRGLIYPFAVRRVRQVIALAGGGPATLFLGLRDPASFLVSAFALQLSFGNEIVLSDYLGGRNPARLGWAGLVRRLAEIPEVARLVVWRYEDYAALRPQILARMLPQDLARAVPDPAPANESLTQPGYLWFRRQAMADSDADLRILVQRARRRFPRSAGHPPLRLLGEAVHARSQAFYAAEIQRLRALPKVEFLEPAARRDQDDA